MAFSIKIVSDSAFCGLHRTSLNSKVAGVTGLEPAASCVTGRRSNQLSYTPAIPCGIVFISTVPTLGVGMVGDHGLEPRTLSV